MSIREIIALEAAVNRLLPEVRVEQRPSAELLSAQRAWSDAVWEGAKGLGPIMLDPEQTAAGLRLATSPVFICGVHRSGTTLLRDLLDGHPDLSVLPAEGSFLTSLRARLDRVPNAAGISLMGREWIRRLANPINQAPYWLLGRTSRERSPYVRFARMLMAWWPIIEADDSIDQPFSPHVAVALAYASSISRSENIITARRWVDKTPTNEFFLERLYAAFPGARVMHVIRHPVAVYASRRKIEERTFGSFVSRRSALRDLAQSLRIAADNQHRSEHRKYLLVTYEDLTAQPRDVMGRVAWFLDIEMDPALLRTTVAHMPSRSNSSFRNPGGPGEILREAKREHGSWLNNPERDLVAAFTGRYAGEFGYDVSAPPVGLRHLLKARFHLEEICRSAVRKVRRLLSV